MGIDLDIRAGGEGVVDEGSTFVLDAAVVGGDEADEIAALVKRHMEGAAQLAVPLTVDVGIGENWKDAKS